MFADRPLCKFLPGSSLFVSVCEFSQAVEDPSLGVGKIAQLVKSPIESEWIDKSVAALQADRPRRKCFMQLLCIDALRQLGDGISSCPINYLMN